MAQRGHQVLVYESRDGAFDCLFLHFSICLHALVHHHDHDRLLLLLFSLFLFVCFLLPLLLLLPSCIFCSHLYLEQIFAHKRRHPGKASTWLCLCEGVRRWQLWEWSRKYAKRKEKT